MFIREKPRRKKNSQDATCTGGWPWTPSARRAARPTSGAHVDLGELEHLAERHLHLAVEPVADAVGVLIVGDSEVLGARVAREDSARDGLAEQRRAVVRQAQRRAPLGGEHDPCRPRAGAPGPT